MNSRRCVTVYFAALALAGLPAAAAVTVSFPSPSYSDIGTRGAEANEVKNELARYLHALDARYLSPGDNLWIEIIDVDLAGNRQNIGGREIRVARGQADIPRITVRYRLERGGRVSSGEETVLDSSYLWFPARHRPDGSLPHEKRMLEAWFREKFTR